MKMLIATLVALSSTFALAATDQQQFDKRVARYGVQLGGQPKGLCLCQDDGSRDRGVGFLLRGTGDPGLDPGNMMIQLSCLVPVFDELTGEQKAQTFCERFVPLAR